MDNRMASVAFRHSSGSRHLQKPNFCGLLSYSNQMKARKRMSINHEYKKIGRCEIRKFRTMMLFYLNYKS